MIAIDLYGIAGSRIIGDNVSKITVALVLISSTSLVADILLGVAVSN